jgi:hypothetical protein
LARERRCFPFGERRYRAIIIIIIGSNMILRFQQVEEVSSGFLWLKKKDGVSRYKRRIWWFLLLRNKDIFPVGDRRKMWLLMIELG